MNFPKKETISVNDTPGSLLEVGGNFTGGNLFATWRQDDRVMARARFFEEMSKNGIYQGSLTPGRWTGATQITSDLGDSSFAIHMNGNEPDLVLWNREGSIMSAPQDITAEIMAAQTTLKSDLDASFVVQLANAGGKFTQTGSRFIDVFDHEKSAGLCMGYGSDVVRMATCQIDKNSGRDDPNSATVTLDYKNKFSDLFQMEITRNYGPIYPKGVKQIVISGFDVDKAIPAGKIYVVKIDYSGLWYPGTVELSNISISGVNPSDVTLSKVFGQTNNKAYVMIANHGASSANVSFDVVAEPVIGVDPPHRVAFGAGVTKEPHVLNGVTPVRFNNLSVNGEQAIGIRVTDSTGEFPYDPNDYIIGQDAENYTTIARSDDSTIPDGDTVLVEYYYANTFQKRLTIAKGTGTTDNIFNFGEEVDPKSLQARIVAVSGDAIEYLANQANQSVMDFFIARHQPKIVVHDQTVNASGVQISFMSKDYPTAEEHISYETNPSDPTGQEHPVTHSGDITVTIELYALPHGTELGTYLSAHEILQDLVKYATYKDIKMHDYSGTLENGKDTTDKPVFIGVDEAFDMESIRVENTSEGFDVNCELIEAGYLYDDDGYQRWGVRVGVTRATNTGMQVDYSFQVWGQYTERTDFFYPLSLVSFEVPKIVTNQSICIKDQTIEDAINKILQVCFADDGATYKLMFGSKGELVLKPYRTETPVAEFRARNMESISKTTKTPMVIDKVHITGFKSDPYLVPQSEKLLHDQSEKLVVPAKTKNIYLTIEFEETIDPKSLRFVVIDKKKCHIHILESSTTKCVIRASNDTKSWYGANNHKEAWIKFKLYGKPLDKVVYQEDYTFKTPAGESGKYGYHTATVDNELITSVAIANQIGASIVAESANGGVTLQPGEMPANLAVEPLDTMMGSYTQQDIATKGIVDEITFTFETAGDGPALTMSPTVRPRDVFAAGFGDGNLSCDGDDWIDGDYEHESNGIIKALLSLIFG
jgi:hypothetical protein